MRNWNRLTAILIALVLAGGIAPMLHAQVGPVTGGDITRLDPHANRCLADVLTTFNAIPDSVPKSKYLRVNMAGFHYPRYTSDPTNPYECTSILGNQIIAGGCQNHFQGFVRLRANALNPDARYALVTGSNPHVGGGADLFVFKMGSRSEEEWTHSAGNLSRTTGGEADWVPDSRDNVIRQISLSSDPTYWHAGGMQALGEVVVIPVEGTDTQDRSRVLFWDFHDPENPAPLPLIISRGNNAKGGVAMATRLTSGPYQGHFLFGVWSDSDSNGKRIDFYLSATTNLMDGLPISPITGSLEYFDFPVTTWWHDRTSASYPGDALSDADASEMGGDRNFSDYQMINIVNQCDGKLFMVGMHNTSGAAPTISGRDFADLFRLEFPSGYTGMPRVVKVSNKHMYCYDSQCNFDAAPGLYIPSRDDRLWLYAAYHWRDLLRLRFNEYAVPLPTDPVEPPPSTSPPPSSPPPPPSTDCTNFDLSQCSALQQCQVFCTVGNSSSIGSPCCGCQCNGSDECPICLLPDP